MASDDRTERLEVSLSPDDRATLKKAAEQRGCSLDEVVHRAILQISSDEKVARSLAIPFARAILDAREAMPGGTVFVVRVDDDAEGVKRVAAFLATGANLHLKAVGGYRVGVVSSSCPALPEGNPGAYLARDIYCHYGSADVRVGYTSDELRAFVRVFDVPDETKGVG